MGITNQQIAELVSQLIEVFDKRLAEIVKTFERERDEHDDFRKAIADLSTAVKLLQARQGQHDDNWKRVWAILAAAVLIPILANVVPLVFK